MRNLKVAAVLASIAFALQACDAPKEVQNGRQETAPINDAPSPSLPDVAPQNDGYAGSDWIKREQIDPMTDEKSVYFLLGYSPRIMVVCLGGGSVGLSLDVEGLLGRTNFPKLREMVGSQATYAPINMLVRLDDAQPSSQEWSLHLSKEFIKPQGDGVEFFKSMRGHKRLVIRPDQMGTYSYDITGANSVYEEMLATCKSQ
jgi:hypothetical protein